MTHTSFISRNAVPAALFLCLFAAQASFLAISPILTELAAEFGVSKASAGQLRTLSGATGAAAAAAVAVLGRRLRVARLLETGLALVAGGAVVSAVAPTFPLLAAAQAPIGAGMALLLAGAIAAAAEWAPAEDRARTLAWALLGQPGAWVAGMPLIGALAGLGWRLAWLLPVSAGIVALVAIVALRPHVARMAPAPALPAPAVAGGARARSLWRRPEVTGWALGELLAHGAWSGTLIYSGALLVESYALTTSATSFVLGAVAVAYFPAALYVRRYIEEHARTLLIGLGLAASAAVALLLGGHPPVAGAAVLLALLMALVGARGLAGSAFGLQAAPADRVAITGVRAASTQLGYLLGGAAGGAALAGGGWAALALVLAAGFALGVVPHLLLTRAPARTRLPAVT